MNYLVTGWWLLFLSAVGLVAGSFLNVIVYRLPRFQSLRVPIWSACPHCRHRIRWYDNLPVLSFLLLRGRCRNCTIPISSRYAVIELAMALVVLLLLDAFMIGDARSGLGSHFGLTDSLEWNWPILLAHVILFGALLAMSAIDLEHYWVDIRCTNFAIVCGFALHIIWTPKYSIVGPPYAPPWPRPSDGLALVSIMALVGLGLTWLWQVYAHDEEAYEGENYEKEDSARELGSVPADAIELNDAIPPDCHFGESSDIATSCEFRHSGESRNPEPRIALPGGLGLLSRNRFGVWVALGVFLGLLSLLFAVDATDAKLSYLPRALIPLALFFALIVQQSTIKRASDVEIVAAIEEERGTARAVVLVEFAYLLPAIILGGIGLWVATSGGDLYQRAVGLLHVDFGISSYRPYAAWQPVWGFATAASGLIVGGAVGWGVRIFFTLLFGKEAFGVGDIHLMAAAGCVVGWQVMLLGFILTCGLAMAGWLVALPFKQSRAIPLGPWLALGFLTVVLLYDRILEIDRVDHLIDALRVIFFRNSQG